MTLPRPSDREMKAELLADVLALQARLDAALKVVEAARAAMDEPLGVLVSDEAEDQEEIARNYGPELAALSAALAVFDGLARSGDA